MPKIVGIHGIGQQLKGEDVLHSEWLPPLRSGLRRVGVAPFDDNDLFCVFYGDLFRPKGRAVGEFPYNASDVAKEGEQELLLAWWREAAASDSDVIGPDEKSRLRTPQLVQTALNALARSRFFAGIAQRALIFDIKQVWAYLQDSDKHAAIQARVESAVADETRVIIGHSLGSIVAYETLCAHPEWQVHTLVTLGSPLGIPNLIFDRLRPQPKDGTGAWPGKIERWFNIADRGDVVALVKELRGCFGPQVDDSVVNNGATAHDVSPYLTAEETGHAIATGLAA